MLWMVLVFILSDSNRSSISEPNLHIIIDGDVQKLNGDVLQITSHQASNFNHSQQRKTDYIFIVLIALFIRLISLVYYQITIVHSPPWFCFVGLSNNSRLSGWKESNLLYKAKLTYQS